MAQSERFPRRDKPKESDRTVDVDRELRRAVSRFLAGQESQDTKPLEDPRDLLDFREEGLVEDPSIRIPPYEKSLQVSPESHVDAVHHEVRGRALESMVNALPTLEAVVVRLHEGILGDIPMKAADLADIFDPSFYKYKRIHFLNRVRDEHMSRADDFDQAILFLLGRSPTEYRTYTFDEIGKLFEWNRESARQTAIRAVKKLQEAATLLKESSDN